MSKCDCQKSDYNCGSSSSGFVFGLICGAIIGAIIAVIIYKNNKTEVFEKLEKKIKSFFENLIPKTEESSTKPKSSPIKSKHPVKKLVAVESAIKPNQAVETKPKEIIPVFVKPKKSPPKTFLKPKK